MTKILNIDTIAPKDSRQIVLNGVTYDLNVTTVENFLEIAKFEETIKASKSVNEQIELFVHLIGKFIPNLEASVLMKADLRQLQLIIDFIRDEIPEEMFEGYKAPEHAEETSEEPKAEESEQVK